MSEAAAPGVFGLGTGAARMFSDDRLARRAAAGDERAFAAIFDRHHQRLYRYCLGIVGDPQDAQDALQNAMVKVLRALPGEERRIELKPWLYRIAHNESIELLRRRRETRQLDPEQAVPGSGLTGEVASRERLRLLFADLDQLPQRQRGALVMRELAGLDYDEIGAALGTSPAVARQTLYEARQSLRQMDEGREMSCEAVTRALSDGDGRVARRRDLRAHLRTCPGCRRFAEEIDGRSRDLAALSPLPAAAAAGLLQGLLGGHGVGGGLATALGGGAAKTVGASAALKGAATVAVVAAIGVGAADRGGLIDAGLSGGGESPAIEAEPPAGADPAGAASGAGSGSSTTGVGESAARAGDGELGGSQAVKGTAVEPAGSTDGKTNGTALPSPTSQGSVSHPSGKGHAKQLPGASAHGQQTAGAHKATGQGSGGSKAKPAKPSHPTKPAPSVKPSNPGVENSGSPPQHSAAGGAPPSEGTAPPAVEGAPAPAAEPKTGKKP